MVYDFGDSWGAEIESVSSLPEYQNATILLRDPTSKAKLFEDPVTARIIAIRSQIDSRGNATGNPTGDKRIRVQFPHDAWTTKVKRGTIVQVVDGGRNAMLENSVIVVDADNWSSQQASHTLECSVNVEVVSSWA
jgi:Family of unknown function (DUF6093)